MLVFNVQQRQFFYYFVSYYQQQEQQTLLSYQSLALFSFQEFCFSIIQSYLLLVCLTRLIIYLQQLA